MLVEGLSDKVALETLAGGGRDLAEEGVAIVPMGGATNITGFLERFRANGDEVDVAGLCDVGEERDSGARSNEPASAPTSIGPGWKRSASMCATSTSRTS